EQGPGRGGAGGVRAGAGLLPDPAGDPRRRGGGLRGPGPGVVRRHPAGALVPAAGVARGAAGGLVPGPVAGGPAPAAAAPAGPVVPAGDQAEDVELGQEAGGAPPPSPANETLPRSSRCAYLRGIGPSRGCTGFTSFRLSFFFFFRAGPPG